MYCPVCSSQILATDARCLNRRTLLIESSEKKSEAFKKSAGRVDGRIYFGVGAFLGFMVALAFFHSEEEMLPTASSIGAVIGGLIGKYIARRKWE